jgi:glycosyltransferase involved in cell wall biosynthesis
MRNDITIALPVYNRTDYIRKALDSAINQTKRCRILLIDNNSPHDDFKTIVDSYHNPDLEYIKTSETVPQEENFNNCFRYAKTPWVTILHDDDMLHYQYVENSVKILEKYGETVGGIAYPSFVSEVEWKDIYTVRELTDDIKVLNPTYFLFFQLPFPGVLVKKDKALELGGFNKALRPISDLDLWYRYSSKVKMIYVNQKMSFYRISASQASSQLIDALINNAYAYRLNKIKSGRYNNILYRLSLEHTRINNIKYYSSTYHADIYPELVNERKFKRAAKILRYKLPDKIVRLYKNRISFSEP